MPARAGFAQPEGAGQIIATSSVSQFSKTFDAQGRLRRASTFSKLYLETHAEYGLTERVTLVGRFGQEALQPGVLDGTNGLVSQRFVEAGARVALTRFDAFHIGELRLSAQVLGGWRSCGCAGAATRAGDAAQTSQGVTLDARMIAALPFALAGMESFAELQAGYRHGGGVERSELRLDATLGVRPDPRWLLLAQLFVASSRAEREAPEAWRVKAELGVVWAVTPRWSVQAGAFTTIAGRNAAHETGAKLAVWRSF
jgi:hypothetical protein